MSFNKFGEFILRCCVIYKEDYPWDVRVEKITDALVAQGHDVTLVCRNIEQKSEKEFCNGFKIKRIRQTKALPVVIRKLINLPFSFNPFWLFLFWSNISKDDVVIVRDIPLLLGGIIVARMKRAKIILDMAECYPEMYASTAQFSKRSLLAKISKSPLVTAIYEKFCVRRVDHSLVMIEESRERLISLGVSPNKVSIVSNTPPLNKYNGMIKHHSGEHLNIVYVGFITRIRGLDLLIRGVHHFVEKCSSEPAIKVDIVGVGEDRAYLIDLVERLCLKRYVTIHGWLEHEAVDKLMNQANVGALTYRVCGHWNHTIPNKLFDYMLAGLPVLTTEVETIGRIVRTEKCGVICKDQSPEDISNKLSLLVNPSTRNYYGTKGHAAVLRKYNWDEDKGRVQAVMSSLSSPSSVN
ncbi:glycosyltransferase family 4 protein [Marinobacter sp. 1Y8]